MGEISLRKLAPTLSGKNLNLFAKHSNRVLDWSTTIISAVVGSQEDAFLWVQVGQPTVGDAFSVDRGRNTENRNIIGSGKRQYRGSTPGTS